MAVVTCDLFSEALGRGTTLTVVLPQSGEAQVGLERPAVPGPPPVLYLLHGLSDDHTAWTRYTSIERYAAARGLAVVMPAADRSFYANEAHGHRYWDWVGTELPHVVVQFFRVSPEPEDTFVAGLSMGGYGALKLALTFPERFAAAASLSGALDVAAIARQPEHAELVDRVWGDRIPPHDDLFALLGRAASLPPMHISCGTEDPLHPASRAFVAAAERAGAEVSVDFRAGAHEWGLWDAVVQDVVDWLPLRAAPH